MLIFLSIFRTREISFSCFVSGERDFRFVGKKNAFDAKRFFHLGKKEKTKFVFVFCIRKEKVLFFAELNSFVFVF